jgi:hypothetical protein
VGEMLRTSMWTDVPDRACGNEITYGIEEGYLCIKWNGMTYGIGERVLTYVLNGTRLLQEQEGVLGTYMLRIAPRKCRYRGFHSLGE